ncbi:hypothetical protein BJ165DRAFT_1466350 [Panaeolus papilionaceus]|nr:hypothetical protein BJ165DRAFT_1466350 [Panaeolus papilionaceus]
MFFSKSILVASVLIASATLVSSTPAPIAFVGPIPRSIQQAEIFLRESGYGQGDGLIPGLANHNGNAMASIALQTNGATSDATSLRMSYFPLIISVAAFGRFLVQSL